MEQPPTPMPARARRRPLLIAVGATLVVVLTATLLLWRPWEEREFAADEVPSACADLAAVKDAESPGSPPDKEQSFDKPGVGRDVVEGARGSTLTCGWTDGEARTLHVSVEHWADGPGEAAASFARSREEWSHGQTADAGDEAAFVLTDGILAVGGVRVGNVIVKIQMSAISPATLTAEDATHTLQTLVTTIEAT